MHIVLVKLHCLLQTITREHKVHRFFSRQILKLTRSIFKKDNCRRLQSSGFFKYKNDSLSLQTFCCCWCCSLLISVNGET